MTTNWNCPVNGDWDTIDKMLPPWANGIATLTHEEVVFVKTETERIIAEYVPPSPWEPATPTDAYVQSEYNNFTNWEKAINGATLTCIKSYDPLVHTLGINENGIILPEVPTDETSDEPTSDNPEIPEDVEETPVEEE